MTAAHCVSYLRDRPSRYRWLAVGGPGQVFSNKVIMRTGVGLMEQTSRAEFFELTMNEDHVDPGSLVPVPYAYIPSTWTVDAAPAAPGDHESSSDVAVLILAYPVNLPTYARVADAPPTIDGLLALLAVVTRVELRRRPEMMLEKPVRALGEEVGMGLIVRFAFAVEFEHEKFHRRVGDRGTVGGQALPEDLRSAQAGLHLSRQATQRSGRRKPEGPRAIAKKAVK